MFDVRTCRRVVVSLKNPVTFLVSQAPIHALHADAKLRDASCHHLHHEIWGFHGVTIVETFSCAVNTGWVSLKMGRKNRQIHLPL